MATTYKALAAKLKAKVAEAKPHHYDITVYAMPLAEVDVVIAALEKAAKKGVPVK